MPFDSSEYCVASPRSEPAVPIGHQRLLVLAEFLEALDINPTLFRMRTLADREENGMPACGSAACALGWGTTIPAFRVAGFRLDGPNCTVFDEKQGWDAVEAFFGIRARDALDLFGPMLPDDRMKAVARIRAFVAEQSIAARTAELTRLG